MYVVVEIAGKHYKVEKGDSVVVDLLHLDNGKKISFNTVVIVRDDKDIKIGQPYVKGVSVDAKIEEAVVKGDKLTIFKYKAKVNYRVKTGHRQKYTRIKITDIKTAASSTAKKSETKEPAKAK